MYKNHPPFPINLVMFFALVYMLGLFLFHTEWYVFLYFTLAGNIYGYILGKQLSDYQHSLTTVYKETEL